MKCGNDHVTGGGTRARSALSRLLSCVTALALAGALVPGAAYASAARAAQDAVADGGSAVEAAVQGVLQLLDAEGDSEDAADSAFLSGEGTEESPYLITSVEDYALLYDTLKADADGTYRSACYELTADIDVSGLGSAYEEKGLCPSSTYAFAGSFDGGGHTVTVAFDGSSYVGLFGYVNGGTVQNVTVTGNAAASTYYGAAIAAYAKNATVSNVAAVDFTLTVGSSGNGGGIVGYATACTVEDASCTNVTVTATGKYVGGVVGYAASSTVEGIVASVAVTSTSYNAAGAIGYATATNMSGITVSGAVEGTYDVGGAVGAAMAGSALFDIVTSADVVTTSCSQNASASGGVVGYLSASDMKNCGNTGNVTAAFSSTSTLTTQTRQGTGGVVGGLTSTGCTVVNCWNTGAVTGNSLKLGGVVGGIYAAASTYSFVVKNCYNRGAVAYTVEDAAGQTYCGGIVGHISCTVAGMWETLSVVNCYNAGATSTTSTGSYVRCAGIVAGGDIDELDLANFQNDYYLDTSATIAVGVGTAGDTYADVAALEGAVETRNADQMQAAGFASVLGVNYADDTTGSYNAGWPYLRWQNPDSTYDVEFDVTLASDGNESADNAISLAVLDQDGVDVSASFAKSAASTSAAATWTLSGVANGTVLSYAVSKKGYETTEGTFTVESASEAIAIALEPTGYSYSVTVSPAEADVTLTSAGATVEEAVDVVVDEEADTATHTFTGLHNNDATSVAVSAYGYTAQQKDVGISFGDVAESIALEALAAYTATVSVTLPAGSEAGAVPNVAVYYVCDGDPYDKTLRYSSAGEAAATRVEDGGYVFAASGLVSGSYTVAVYANGCTTQTLGLAVDGADASCAVSLEAAGAWDGSSYDVLWYTMADEDATEYYLYTAADLAGLSALVGGGASDVAGNAIDAVSFSGATVHLAADVDLGGTNDEPACWTPIGAWVTPSSSAAKSSGVFAGSFDGGGHTVANLLVGTAGSESTRLHAQSATGTGLFSLVAGTASAYVTIGDLTLENANVSTDENGTDAKTGAGVLASASCYANVEGVVVSGGSVSHSSYYVGGLVGYAYYGSFTDCSNSASVTSPSYDLGGIAGYANGCSFTRCANSGDVASTNSGSSITSVLYGAGGICGADYASDVFTACANSGAVSGALPSLGGILGASAKAKVYQTFANCYNVGTVANTATYGSSSTYYYAGGIVGGACVNASYQLFANCYNAAAVGDGGTQGASGTLLAGGLIGRALSVAISTTTAANSYFASDIDGAPSCAIGGNNSNTVAADVEGACEALAASEMQASSFVTTLGNAYRADAAAANGGYPVLLWQSDEAIWLPEATVSVAAATYTGEALEPELTVTVGDKTLAAGTDYVATYADNVNAGTGTVTLEPADGSSCVGSTTAGFTIDPASIAAAAVTLAEDEAFVYDGGAQQATVTSVVLGEGDAALELEAGTDYTVSYEGNVNAGTATAVVSGTGNYTATATASFTIEPAAIADAVIAAIDSQTYTGQAIEPGLSVSWNGSALAEGDDFTVAYADNTDVGTATATIVGCGNFTGELSATFTIVAAAVATVPTAVEGLVYTGSEQTGVASGEYYTVTGGTATDAGTYTATARLNDVANYVWADTGTADDAFVEYTIAAVSLGDVAVEDVASQTYAGGEAIEPALTLTFNGMTLAEGTDYTVSYRDNVNAGTATATATGCGNYVGSVAVSFTIAPVEVPVPEAASGLVYTGEEQTGVAAGELYTVEGGTATDAGSYTVTAGLADKANYVWAGTGSASDVAIEYTIAAASIADADVESVATRTYTGYAIQPEPAVVLDGVELALGSDYTLTYSHNTDVGTATVTATGCGNYAGSVSTEFAIEAASVADAELAAIAAQDYTGAAITPGVSLTLGSYALAEGTDYVVVYADNIECGTATATIVGTGNFTGVVATSFTIAKTADDAAADLSQARDALSVSVSGIQGALSAVSVSADGTDVAAGSAWVTQGDYDALVAALAEASDVLASDDATADDVTAASSALSDALAVFVASIGSGTYASKAIYKENVTLSATSYTYSGKNKTPGVTVRVNGTKLAKGTDYTVSYSSGTRKAIGTYAVTVTGTGGYAGTVTKTFTIEPGAVKLKSAKAGAKNSKKLTVKWAKRSGGVKYQIAYRVKGTKTWKYATADTKACKKVLKGLKKGKKYQVRVRACKKVGSKTYYGSWSKTKSANVR